VMPSHSSPTLQISVLHQTQFASCFLLVDWLTPWLWLWRWYFCVNSWWTTRVQGITSQKIVLFNIGKCLFCGQESCCHNHRDYKRISLLCSMTDTFIKETTKIRQGVSLWAVGLPVQLSTPVCVSLPHTWWSVSRDMVSPCVEVR
jgi:hypothetical protein